MTSLCCGKTLQVCKVYGLVCIRSFLRICINQAVSYCLKSHPTQSHTAELHSSKGLATAPAAQRSPGLRTAVPPPPPDTKPSCVGQFPWTHQILQASTGTKG